MSRRAAKVDANQAELVALFRGIGFSVWPTHTAGEGFPDLSLGRWGRNFLVEVKDGAKPPSARLLTPAQQRWHADWRGQVSVISSVEQALDWAASMKAKA